MQSFFAKAFLRTGFMLTLGSVMGAISRYMAPVLIMQLRGMIFIPLFITMGLVMFFNSRIERAFLQNDLTTISKFSYINVVLFGGLVGIITFAYNTQLIGTALMLTSFIFTISAGYGYVTGKDMSKLGPVIQCLSTACMALVAIGLIVSFFNRKLAQYIFSVESFLSIILSIVFTIYFIKSTKTLYLQYRERKSALATLNYYCSYVLFSNFLNLFLSILYLLGRKNRD